MSRHIQTRQIMYLPPNPKLCMSYEVNHEEKWFLGFKHWDFKNPPKSFILEWLARKDPGLPFHFHVIDLFKSWSNLGFDQDSNGHKHSKKSKNQKPKLAHIVFLCHIVRIEVDKQGLDIFKLDKSCIYPLKP
jgi:hypothetical protein